MKYLITESQIDKIIFKYLDNLKFTVLKSETDTFFVNNKDDEYAQIRLRNDGVCYIYYRLIDEISSFFSLHPLDSERVIGRWVGNTLQTEVTHTLEANLGLNPQSWEYLTN
jgi:hypothetical protein